MINAIITPLLILLQAREDTLLFKSDRIYTVLAVVLIIFAGLLFFLINTERKVKKLEDKLNKMDGQES